ncbi:MULTISPECIES: flagellin hook IN motif-containing protein, partial [unclassified Campylobacter]|uniref:flagellin hook IN motif-containing protein n=1 Tax=unclassified Campylobacter TaxID=2593542 RepID=UPI001D37C835|nr:hypothetical protein [Campylobacter sp. RM9331]MBZ8006501.1 hypothetical protein [Campylobacter sp. RM9332]
AADLTGTASVTFKNVDGINDVTIEPVKLTNGKGDVSATTGLGALAEAINKASDKTGIKASVTAQSVFEQPIKAGETTSNFSINGVKIGTVSVQEKDANGALRAAINAVKDQTGVEASVDTKGRLVLANRDGRGIKVEDNVKAERPVVDNHSLVTQGAVGKENTKKGVDFNAAATWTTAAGAEGSILVKENTFADVKNAHGVQDSLIYQDGLNKAKNASIPSAAYKTYKAEEKEALDAFKKGLTGQLDTFIQASAEVDNTAKGLKDKAAANAAAVTLKDALTKTDDIAEIQKALATFETAAATETTALGNLQTSVQTLIDNYANSVSQAAKKIPGNLDGVDMSKGIGKTMVDAAADLEGGIVAAGAAGGGTANDLKTISDLVGAFETAAAGVKTAEVDFATLAADKLGALNLAVNTAGTSGVEKEITDLFNDLKTQKTIDGANSTIDKINQKLDKLIDAADGKTMDTKEAQEGMVAHSFKQFFAGIKAGLNEPNKAGMSSIVGLNTDNATNMGRLSLVANNGRDIQVEVKDANGFTTNSAIGYDKNVSEATVSLRETNATINKAQADAMGFNANEWQAGDNGDNQNGYAAGVMTLKGAQAMMNIAETAQKALEAI